MARRQCLVDIDDFVRVRDSDTLYGFVTYIDTMGNNGDYYIEIAYDEEADPLYFYDDELVIVKLIKE
jgi:hypothetical protein